MVRRFAAQQRPDDRHRVLQRGERAPVVPEPQNPLPDARADTEPDAAAGQFIQRGKFRGDQGRMMLVKIDDAEPNADPLSHCGARSGDRHDAAVERIFGEPQRGKTIGLGGRRKLQRSSRPERLRKPYPEAR